jgi:hypothetical protein
LVDKLTIIRNIEYAGLAAALALMVGLVLVAGRNFPTSAANFAVMHNTALLSESRRLNLNPLILVQNEQTLGM